MDGVRWLSLLLAVTLLVTGSLAPAGWAQQPQRPEASPEALKAVEQRMGMEPEPREMSPEFYSVAAGAATLVNVPGRTVLCVTGTAVGLAVLLVTLGSGYRAATKVVEEGCRGPWVITADDVKPRPGEGVMSGY